MARRASFPHSVADLAPEIALFPLSDALLLPRGRLPLNVFEPRYLALVDDALAGARLIGIIRPTEPEALALDPADTPDRPPLSAVGCAGRIVAFAETGDRRYAVSLVGLVRFRVLAERDGAAPYRLARVDYAPFAADFEQAQNDAVDRPGLIDAARALFAAQARDLDWATLERLETGDLVTALAMLAPFTGMEKQALLEARDTAMRAALIVALAERAMPDDKPRLQ